MRGEAESQQPIIVVHGTFAKNGRWWRREGDFCERLDDVLRSKDSNARCWLGSSDLFYSWDGKNSEQSRSLAAVNLAQHLEHVASDTDVGRIHVVAHSHGGNVLLKALYRIYMEGNAEVINKIGDIVLLGTPRLSYDSIKRKFNPSISYTPQKAPIAAVKAIGIFAVLFALNNYLLTEKLVTGFWSHTFLFTALLVGWITSSVFFDKTTPSNSNSSKDTFRVHTINGRADEAIALLKIIWEVRASSRERARDMFRPSGPLFFLQRNLFFTRELAITRDIQIREIIRNREDALFRTYGNFASNSESYSNKPKWKIRDLVLHEISKDIGVPFPSYIFDEIRTSENLFKRWFTLVSIAACKIILGVRAIFQGTVFGSTLSQAGNEHYLGNLVIFVREKIPHIISMFALAIVLSADFVLGSLIEHISVHIRRYAFVRGVHAVTSAAIGDDNGQEQINGIMEDFQVPFTEIPVLLPQEVEEELVSNSRKFASKITTEFYSEDAYNRTDLEILSGRISSSFGGGDDEENLVHCQYYRNSEVIKTIAEIIARNSANRTDLDV